MENFVRIDLFVRLTTYLKLQLTSNALLGTLLPFSN